MVWNHSDVSSHVSYSWNRWTALRVRLEDHGVYRFDAIVALTDAFCREHLARFKTPRQWFFVGSFPMTPSGKIRKFEVRQGFAEPSETRLQASSPRGPSTQA